MAIFFLIPRGDLALTDPDPTTGKRSLILATGAAYVKQKIASRLKFFLGEWFLDKRLGVPWYQDVFTKNPNLDIARSVFRQVILSVFEVASIDSLNLDYNEKARTLGVDFSITLLSGEALLVRPADSAFILSLPQAA